MEKVRLDLIKLYDVYALKEVRAILSIYVYALKEVLAQPYDISALHRVFLKVPPFLQPAASGNKPVWLQPFFSSKGPLFSPKKTFQNYFNQRR